VTGEARGDSPPASRRRRPGIGRLGAWLGAAAAWCLAAAAASAQSPAAGPARVRTEDAEFVEAVAADLRTEVALGRLAAQKATRADLRKLAQAIAEGSSRSHSELETIAAQKKLELPVEPRPEHRAALAALDALSGKAFDDAFLLAVSNARTRALDLYTQEASSWGDPDVKAWAEKALPEVKEHLALVKQLSEPPATARAPLP
jgi:putative membrane protein